MKLRLIGCGLLGLFLILSATCSPGRDETATLLYQNVQSLKQEGEAAQEKGDLPSARERYRTAVYLLEKIRQDFPDWNSQTVSREAVEVRAALDKLNPPASPPPTPSASEPVACTWQMLFAGPEFEPEEGSIYQLALEGEDRQKLKLSFKKIKPYGGDARICVQLRDTPRKTVLQDIKNQGLFQKEAGEFPISLAVPPGSQFYLAEFTEKQVEPPVILSNILELP